MVAIAALLMLRGLRAGRVEVDPAPRAVARKAAIAVDVPSPVIFRESVPAPAEEPVRSAAVEVIDAKVPYATARAVNSWFDFESALSDLSGCREVLGEETYRQEVIRMTAEFLELAPERVPAFESTLRVVQADLRKVQQQQGQELAAYPVDLSDADLQKLQSDSDERFRPRREAALARFGTFLDDRRDRHREFRVTLESWVTRCCGLDP